MQCKKGLVGEWCCFPSVCIAFTKHNYEWRTGGVGKSYGTVYISCNNTSSVGSVKCA